MNLYKSNAQPNPLSYIYAFNHNHACIHTHTLRHFLACSGSVLTISLDISSLPTSIPFLITEGDLKP